MDHIQPKTRQERKGNKEKRNKELAGKYTSKHVRIAQEKQKSKSVKRK